MLWLVGFSLACWGNVTGTSMIDWRLTDKQDWPKVEGDKVHRYIMNCKSALSTCYYLLHTITLAVAILTVMTSPPLYGGSRHYVSLFSMSVGFLLPLEKICSVKPHKYGCVLETFTIVNKTNTLLKYRHQKCAVLNSNVQVDDKCNSNHSICSLAINIGKASRNPLSH